MRKYSLILLLLASVLLVACTSDSDFESEVTEKSIESSDELESISATASLTCDNPLIGPATVSVPSDVNYSVTPKIPTSSPTQISWSSTTGMTIISGQGTKNVTVRFAAGFTSGILRVSLNGGQCATEQRITKQSVGSVSCPTSMQIAYAAGQNFCDDFLISLAGANHVQSVSWYYSIKGTTNKFFGTSTNPTGQYSIAQPLYLPSDSYNNHILWVTAQITLTNGSKCTLKSSRTVTCSGGGSGGGSQ